jgi:hypothetical protein
MTLVVTLLSVRVVAMRLGIAYFAAEAVDLCGPRQNGLSES